MKNLILSAAVLLFLAGCSRPHMQPEERVTVPPGAPRAVVKLARQGQRLEVPLFNDTVGQFAKQHGFHECEVPHYTEYSGPGYVRVLYKNEQFAIWAWAGSSAVFHITPYTTNYSSQEFERLTNAFVGTLQQVFSNRVELNPTNMSQ
jgi:hypothetical protein